MKFWCVDSGEQMLYVGPNTNNNELDILSCK